MRSRIRRYFSFSSPLCVSPLQMTGIDAHGLTAIHAETVDPSRITHPHATTYLSPPGNLHHKTLRGRDLSAVVKRDAGSMWRGIAELRISRVSAREKEREDVTLRSRFTGHWGEVTSVAVAAAMSELRRAHTSHARLARGAARRCRRRVLVDTIANGTDILVEGCVSTRKAPNPRGLGLMSLFGSETTG